MNDNWCILIGNAEDRLKEVADNSVQCCITSPPYYGLRDYGTGKWIGGDPNCKHYRTTKYSANDCTGHKAMGDAGQAVGDAIYKTYCPLCGAVRVDEQIGLEETPEEYIERLVKVFREVKRVLKDDGTLWVNIGDSYAGGAGRWGASDNISDKQSSNQGSLSQIPETTKWQHNIIKQKDLIGIPWMLAFALRKDGWYLRQDIIWCLSGNEYVYAKTSYGVKPIEVRTLSRIDTSKVQLWNGTDWVNIIAVRKNEFVSDRKRICLRSGQEISCTGGHHWVLSDGTIKTTDELKVGDVLKHVDLPDESGCDPGFMTDDLAWFIGLYLAEGSKSNKVIQIALNADEIQWFDRIRAVSEYMGGSASYTLDGNKLNVRCFGAPLISIINYYIGGNSAKNKHLNSDCWRLSNSKLKCILNGYFDGDGHYDTINNRIRLGFTRNIYLERDLRVAAARLGATITLKKSSSKIGDKKYLTFKGEWRYDVSDHFNNKNRCEIISIKNSYGKCFYDIEVDSDDHTFALSSGVITHNCKTNPMPESVKDRCVKSHEYIFLLSKKPQYKFNYEAIREEAVSNESRAPGVVRDGLFNYDSKRNDHPEAYLDTNRVIHGSGEKYLYSSGIKFGGNKYGDSNDTHFQTYSGNEYVPTGMRTKRDVWNVAVSTYKDAHFATYPEELILPCILASTDEGDTVLDPFNGSGTTGSASLKNKRKYLGVELNPEYVELSSKRLEAVSLEMSKYNLW